MEIFADPFEPHWLWRGGMAQTIVGSQFPGKTPLPPRRAHKVKVGPNAVLILRELSADSRNGPLVLMAHGMGGCSESGYLRRIARKLWIRGLSIIMMNHRGSGPCLGMSDALWNGGSSEDFEAVVGYLMRLYPDRPLLLVGFSLSGNVLLKYLGEGRAIPSQVVGAFSVNPPVDLKISSGILSHSSASWIFSPYYMKLVHNQVQALAECFPGAFRIAEKQKTIWDFDVAYTAPAGGFNDVEEYYSKSSANQFLQSISVPTTILCAKDDPFIPPGVFESVEMSPTVNYFAPEKGGHMGYISRRKTRLGDHRWMDDVLVKWIEDIC